MTKMEYRPELYIIYSITDLPVCMISIVYLFILIMDVDFKKKQNPKIPFQILLAFFL